VNKIALLLVVAAAVAVPAAAKGPQAAPVLVLVSDGRMTTLERVDPASLDQREGRVVTFPNPTSLVATSPDHSRVAIAAGPTGRVWIVDPATMTARSTRVALVGVAAAARWTSSGLVVLVSGREDAVLTTGPRLGRPRRHPLGGKIVAVTRGDDALVAVVGPRDGLGPARVAVVDRNGTIRFAALPEIQVGFGQDPVTYEARVEIPAVALSPDASRAVVVGTSGAVAEVELGTLRATSHLVARRSLAKSLTGGSRTAVWLGTTIVVGGVDAPGGFAVTPMRLTLIDSQTWRVRRTTASAAHVAAAGDGVVTFGSASIADLGLGFESGAPSGGEGVAAYTQDGELRFRVLAGAPILDLDVAGGYAYARYISDDSSTWSVIDLADGRILNTTLSRGELNVLEP
jgi:hypothetical protein